MSAMSLMADKRDTHLEARRWYSLGGVFASRRDEQDGTSGCVNVRTENEYEGRDQKLAPATPRNVLAVPMHSPRDIPTIVRAPLVSSMPSNTTRRLPI
jgi:hypothetical protein